MDVLLAALSPWCVCDTNAPTRVKSTKWWCLKSKIIPNHHLLRGVLSSWSQFLLKGFFLGWCLGILCNGTPTFQQNVKQLLDINTAHFLKPSSFLHIRLQKLYHERLRKSWRNTLRFSNTSFFVWNREIPQGLVPDDSRPNAERLFEWRVRQVDFVEGKRNGSLGTEFQTANINHSLVLMG